MNTQDIVLPIADLIVWTFDNVLVPIGNIMSRTGWEFFWAFCGIGGLALWLWFQSKYNKEAANDPNQIK